MSGKGFSFFVMYFGYLKIQELIKGDITMTNQRDIYCGKRKSDSCNPDMQWS